MASAGRTIYYVRMLFTEFVFLSAASDGAHDHYGEAFDAADAKVDTAGCTEAGRTRSANFAR